MLRDGAAMSVRAILLCGPGGGILMERIYSPELVHGAPEGRALWRQAIAGAASDLANALAEDEEVRKKGVQIIRRYKRGRFLTKLCQVGSIFAAAARFFWAF